MVGVLKLLNVRTTFQKFGVSQFFFFLKKLILLFSKDALNCSKLTVKTFIMLQVLSVSTNAVLLNFIHQRILKT